MLALMLCASAGGAWAQSAPTTASQDREDRPAETVEAVEVTGSRLQNGDPTAQVIVISEEEIKARGVTSVEDLIRTLPQNLATIGAITNERGRGPLSNRSAPVSQLGSLGVSAANLGGMGAANTLILVNGRRIAGAAGIEDGFANLNGIPLSAVERVEISLGGASAVYGSDAIGGVINFILKKDFVGSTLTVQHEDSNNDMNTSRISLFSGYAWGSGSISGTLDYSRRQPLNNYKSGFVTEDYRDYFNGNPNYDFRSYSRGLQPGIISQPTYIYDPATFTTTTIQGGYTVPLGFTGRPSMSDMILIGPERLSSYVPELAGPETESTSLSLNLDQKITSKLSFFIDGLYNRSTNTQDISFDRGLTVSLAPGQYYNPFPAYYFDSFNPGVSVSYNPQAEVSAGVLPAGRMSNTSSNWSVNAGLNYQINVDTKLEFVYSTSQSNSDGDSYIFGSLASLTRDATAPGGLRCTNFFLENHRYSAAEEARLRPIYDRQCLALTSADPNQAFNPWKSTVDGGGVSVSEFYYKDAMEVRGSRLENYELRLNGVLANLPAGKLFYVVGGEYNSDGVDGAEVTVRTGAATSRDRYAYFGEFTAPLFGRDFNFPLMRSLVVNVAARNDSYVTEGAVGTVGGVLPENGGELIIGKNTFSRTTPAYGLRWEPFDTLAFRAKWTEGFAAPPPTQLFAVSGTVTYSTIIFDDPLYSCIGCVSYLPTRNAYQVPSTTAPNPDLKPQTSKQSSYGMTWRPTGRLEGLTLDVNYNKTEIHNEFANRSELARLLPQSEVLQLPQFYPRDANGRIIAAQNMIFNILGSNYESISYEASYLWQSPWGTFEPKVTYLDNLKAERRGFEGHEPISSLGKLQGADDYKVVGSVGWYNHDITAMLWANYTPSYINDYEVLMSGGNITNPDYSKPVGSMLTFDLTAGWRIDNKVRLNFAGRNIFDADAPFVVVSTRPYDTARYNPAGRTLSLELQYSF
jgi:iron complex outermembrane recepter protein